MTAKIKPNNPKKNKNLNIRISKKEQERITLSWNKFIEKNHEVTLSQFIRLALYNYCTTILSPPKVNVKVYEE